jgi:hypothetical protein
MPPLALEYNVAVSEQKIVFDAEVYPVVIGICPEHPRTEDHICHAQEETQFVDHTCS